MRYLIERSQECSQQLLSHYADQDGYDQHKMSEYNVLPPLIRLRQEEIDAMSGPDEFREFYRRLKRLNEHYSE